MLINPSPNHLATAQLPAQGQYLEHYLIMLYYHSAINNSKHCKRLVTKLHDKAKHFKIKAYASIINLARPNNSSIAKFNGRLKCFFESGEAEKREAIL